MQSNLISSEEGYGFKNWEVQLRKKHFTTLIACFYRVCKFQIIFKLSSCNNIHIKHNLYANSQSIKPVCKFLFKNMNYIIIQSISCRSTEF